jgi:DNA-binding transcriptional LysR family regulator
MPWDELRYLLAASRSGSLSGAASALGVDRATVGRTLARLEQQIGAKLVQRSRDGLALTALAEQLLPSIEAMEQSALQIERRASGEDARLSGVVRVATTDAFAERILVRALPDFLERYPGLGVDLLTGNQVIDLARRDADVSIRAVRPTQSSLVARKASDLAAAIYAAESYVERFGTPDPANGFRGHRFVGYAASVAGWPEVAWLAKNAAAATVSVRLTSIPVFLAACSSGLGLAILPCFLGDAEPALRRVVPPDIGLQREVWVVVHQDTQRNARVRAFVDFLSELLEREAPQLRGQPRRARSRGPVA